jgi:hypothetical protein
MDPDIGIVLPVLALLLLAVGVYVARSQRRALIGAGLALAASMLVLAAGLLVFRGVYLNSVLPADAAAALFDALVRFIKQGLRTVLLAGLVIALRAGELEQACGVALKALGAGYGYRCRYPVRAGHGCGLRYGYDRRTRRGYGGHPHRVRCGCGRSEPSRADEAWDETDG